MSPIYAWAKEWGVSAVAVSDLMQRMGVGYETPQRGPTEGMSETAIQNIIRLDAARNGVLLFRNNKGAYQDDKGNFVRYGLCNDNKKLGASIRSADLIGVAPQLITIAHVGRTIGQFVSVEVKEGGWTFTGGEHEDGQRKWQEIIIGKGGRAEFATGVLKW